MTQPSIQPVTKRSSLQTIGMLLIPVILLAGVIDLFLSTGGGLELASPAPVENLNIERYHLERNTIELHVRNTGPEELRVASVIINDAVMPFEVSPSPVIPRLGRADIHINYAWTAGEAYGITIFTGNAIPFSLEIPVAFETPQPSSSTLWSLTLIGIYVGVIPVFLIIVVVEQREQGPAAVSQ